MKKTSKQLEQEEREIERYTAIMETKYQQAIQAGLPEKEAQEVARNALSTEALNTIRRILKKYRK